jgi:hypothetical protein
VIAAIQRLTPADDLVNGSAPSPTPDVTAVPLVGYVAMAFGARAVRAKG